jgi:hypothetical protein
MTPEEKKSKAKNPLAPVKRLSFAANLADVPRSDEVKAPTYIEKGTAGFFRGRSSNRSDRGRTGMGWQERTARNAQLDANYRAALGASSSEGIAADANRTSIVREGMGNRTAKDIAQGRDRTDLKTTRIRTGALIANRNTMEAGMDRRQGSQQDFLSAEQEKKYGWLEGESEKERLARIQAIREGKAADMVGSGVFTDPRQVKDYMGDPEYDYEGGLGAVDNFNQATKGSEFQYVPPQFKSRMDLKRGVTESVEVSPEGVLNKSSGNIRRTVDEESIVNKYFDSATGTSKIPIDKLTGAEIDILIKKLKEKNLEEE